MIEVNKNLVFACFLVCKREANQILSLTLHQYCSNCMSDWCVSICAATYFNLCSSKTIGLTYFFVCNSNIGLSIVLVTTWMNMSVNMYVDIIAFLTLLWTRFLDMNRNSCFTSFASRASGLLRFTLVLICLPWTGDFISFSKTGLHYKCLLLAIQACYLPVVLTCLLGLELFIPLN
jgi:hypothetical protein